MTKTRSYLNRVRKAMNSHLSAVEIGAIESYVRELEWMESHGGDEWRKHELKRALSENIRLYKMDIL